MYRNPKNGAVYVHINGELRHLPNPPTADQLIPDWGKRFKNLPSVHFNSKTIGEPLRDNSMLIKGDKTGAVYLLSNKAQHIANPETFNAFGFSWGKIKIFPQIIVDALPKGPLIGGY